MFPYLDRPGFEARTTIPPNDVEIVETLVPGYVEQRIASRSSWINARLRKRYGNNPTAGSSLPLGQKAPPLDAAGGGPPPDVALFGRPVLGSLQLLLSIVTAGQLGASSFVWSADAGQSWTLGPTLGQSGTPGPVIALSGSSGIEEPGDLQVGITTAGSLTSALYQWSTDGGQTWTIGEIMASSGTSPPEVILTGSSNLATPGLVQVQITTLGALGTAVYEWSADGGSTWTTGLVTSAQATPLGSTGLSVAFAFGVYAVDNLYTGQGIATAASVQLGETGLELGFAAGSYSTSTAYFATGTATAASVQLGETGMAAQFQPGDYLTDNVYTAPTPVPETVLAWLVALVSVDVMRKRGVNPQDPMMVGLVEEMTTALAEVKEAADSKDGLFDLPVNEDGDSAVVTGGPMSYSETSPYVSADLEACQGRREDGFGRGTTQS